MNICITCNQVCVGLYEATFIGFYSNHIYVKEVFFCFFSVSRFTQKLWLSFREIFKLSRPKYQENPLDSGADPDTYPAILLFVFCSFSFFFVLLNFVYAAPAMSLT